MIAYVDKRPHVEPRNGHFLLTMESGGEEVKLLLTRHALSFLMHNCERELALVNSGCTDDAEVIPLPPKKRRKRV